MQQKVVVLAGPTAVGKTAALVQIQQYIAQTYGPAGLEVINCDSVQVFRHLDIGSAKPGSAVCAQIPHHLIDFLDPTESFSAGDFVRNCAQLIPAIAARGNVPVVSGGTVFYMRSFLCGLPAIPPLGGAFGRQLQELSSESLRQRLRQLDPVSWRRIHPNDRQRQLRACEVSLETGRPFSSYKLEDKIDKGAGESYQSLVLALERPRAELYQRIDLRVQQMFAQGLVAEIRKLRELGYRHTDCGLQGIGYREFFAPQNGQDNGKDNGQDEAAQQNAQGEPENLVRLQQKIQQHSRNYAKRQLTFIRQLPGVQFYPAENARAVAERIGKFYFGSSYSASTMAR